MKRMLAPIQYYGGKGTLLGALMRLVPAGGRPYCEPFCGAATLFFARDPAPVEVLNDLNGEIVNLFRVIQDRTLFREFAHRIRWTLYSRAELARAIEIRRDGCADPVTRAWAIYVCHNQTTSGRRAKHPADWGRVFSSSRGMAGTASQWLTRILLLRHWHRRLQRVQIDCRDAIEAIRYWDAPEAVFYVDPPYHLELRNAQHQMDVETPPGYHRELANVLLQCQGAVVLSGYEHPDYDILVQSDWQIRRCAVVAHSAARIRRSKLRGPGSATKHAARTECIWLNPRAIEMLECQRGGSLFSAASEQ